MGQESVGARVCDAGALIAIDRGDPRVRAAFRDAKPNVVPAAVLAQVWRNGRRQARLAAFLNAKSTIIEPLDELTARAAGAMLERSGASDVVDASVVVTARRHRGLVLTSDAADLLRIDPGLDLAEL